MRRLKIVRKTAHYTTHSTVVQSTKYKADIVSTAD